MYSKKTEHRLLLDVLIIHTMGSVDDMNNKQVEESIKRCYSTWGESYYHDFYTNAAAYPPVQRDIIKSLLRDAKVKNVLEAGCGPASLLRDFIDLGVDLYGFDLTPEMLAEGKKVFLKQGLNPDNLWQGSVLNPGSFIQPHGEKKTFDAAICIGVLPHIPEDCDVPVIQNLRDSVAPGGLVVIEARNQFFSLFTLNRYSHNFFVNDLIRLDELRNKAGDQVDVLDNAMTELASHFSVNIPPIQKGKAGEPGYDEVLSRTHNPLLLKEQFESTGFHDVKLLFYHYHCIPPMFSSGISNLFIRESIAMEKNPSDWRGMFMASAFLIAGKKND
jgi:SAM-dependent methyltransferase